ncbi:MAG TPA: hypothetical protein VKX17_28235 [Planctomycetota bacterium]|nr:hypothetical protein [Planctomycetota bacterium]
MSKDAVFITLLYEDVQHRSFASRFLKERKFDTRKLREVAIKPGKGSAEQFVREQFIKELKWFRARSSRAATCLIVIADADKLTVQDRLDWFEKICRDEPIQFRTPTEKFAFIIPKRNIETWLAYLRGEEVVELAADDQDKYPKYKKEESRCQPQVEKLAAMCRRGKLEGNPPPSLQSACAEFQRLGL